MKIDKNYCMSSFLQFRYVYEREILFKDNLIPNYTKVEHEYDINNSSDIDKAIKDFFKKNVDDKTALMLSGGIDSAILASYMPKGSKAFTLKCVAENFQIDETEKAKKIAKINGLDHEIIEITWDDYDKYCEILLEHKKAPFHSIEVQIYKAALRAKELGYDKLLFGESADSLFGGLDGLLSKDWEFEQFVERYNYIDPTKVLKNGIKIYKPFESYKKENGISVHEFLRKEFFEESVNSYLNACNTAGIEFLGPYTKMKLVTPLDIERIRNGENKYLIRELFKLKYPNSKIEPKLPMPRAVDIWFKKWNGPSRKEFLENCVHELNGNQKWLIYILEKFLNHFEIR